MKKLVGILIFLLLVTGVPSLRHLQGRALRPFSSNAMPAINCNAGLGGRVVSAGQTVEVTILPPDADFTSQIRLVERRDRIIGLNQNVGRVVRFTRPAGTELIFGIRVNETGQFFRTGPGSRNSDGAPHAVVQCVDSNTAVVGFEDKINSDSLDYNDVVIRVSTQLTGQCGLPVQASINGLPLNNSEGFAISDSFTQADEPVTAVLDKQQLHETLAALSKFVNETHGTQQFLDLEARNAGLSTDTITLGKKVVILNNRIVKAAKQGKEPNISINEIAELAPLLKSVAQSGFPKSNAFRAASEQAQRHHASPQVGCGGLLDFAPCPPFIESAKFFASKADVTNYVQFLGYHLVPRYATTPVGFSNQIDFALVVSKSGCSTPGALRNEIVIRQEGECWTYSTEGPEPNPEILSYIWPSRLWPAYVFLWHRTFC